MALLTTIDGDLHCINRGTGEVLWTRSPQVTGAVVSSNVTKYSRSRNPNHDVLGGTSFGTGAGVGAQLGGDIKYDSDDWTFIVEPSETPRLYLYSNASGLQPVGPLVQLVSNSPHIRPDGKRITGGKKTSLVELELRSGEIVDEFESETGCTGPEGLKGSDSGLTIILGQAEYTLCIADPLSGMQWDISYSEYFPVTENPSTERKGPITWIGSDKDGLVAFWNAAAGIMWRKKFNSPTTAVFEVFMVSKTGKATLARQRKPEGMSHLTSRAYVGIYQDQLYVLSEQNYPLLGNAELEITRPYLGIEGSEDSNEDEHDMDCRAGSPYFPGCMVGPHMISFPFSPDGFPAVGGGGSSQGPDKQDERKGKSKPISISDADDPFAPSQSILKPTTLVGWLVIAAGILTGLVYSKGAGYLAKPVDSFMEERNVQFKVRGLVRAVTQRVGFVNTAVMATSSALGISSRDRRDSLPAFNDMSIALPIHNESEQLTSSVQEKASENETEWNEKQDKGGRKGPRSKPSEQRSDDGKINNANGTGGGSGGGIGGGRKKKRGAGGKGQKAAAAAAAAAAATAAVATGTVDALSGENGSKSTSEQKDEGSMGSGIGESNDDAIQTGETAITRSQSTAPVLKSIQVTETILGYGSHGTVVYKGTYDGRSVAVKRLLIDFYDVAFHEVRLLQESDDHSNVVRYFRSEQCDRFLYIALELCSASLDDIIERGHIQQYQELSATLEPQKILHQIILGIHHLHSLKIVHRDIKPQNILIGEPKRRPKPSKSATSMNSGSPETPKSPPLGSSGMITSVVRANYIPSPALDLYPGRVLISDFGLCRKLENDQSSFHNSTVHGGKGGAGGGTVGWRAPECLSGLDQDDEMLQAMVNGSVGAVSTDESSSSSQGTGVRPPGRANRMTRAIDIFSAGCVFYYVLMNGDHPFGDRYSRERNILLNRPNLSGLDSMGPEGVEAKDLISRMIAHNPADRPDAFTDCSDRFEIEDRGMDSDQLSPLLVKLETNAKEILGKDWYKVIDRTLVDNLGRYRKYDGNSVRDLLRALRNKTKTIAEQ
ncbi:bifunctional endoribonuclease/protein kinase ire1 [Modicella reniformis]|uniref:non-specific serine/threonine protein kinase n=1 Tax=Modicella reniformis TaxID=1440133 RepID=A0A9P6J1C6_9FUNG|nr:bifunctional endoribonuclease/protein kinase ire1 [Modicella reniformis]